MLCDEFPDHDALSPQTIGGTPVMIHLYVEDVDAFAARAIGAGIKVLRPVTDQFYRERDDRRWCFGFAPRCPFDVAFPFGGEDEAVEAVLRAALGQLRNLESI
jgi:hypothetical protein